MLCVVCSSPLLFSRSRSHFEHCYICIWCFWTWWWCWSATDHHLYTLCVIKFVDCVPTWIQIIRMDNGMCRNGECCALASFFIHFFSSLLLPLSSPWPFIFFSVVCCCFVSCSKFIWISVDTLMFYYCFRVIKRTYKKITPAHSNKNQFGIGPFVSHLGNSNSGRSSL